MASTALRTGDDSSKSILALVCSISPLYFLIRGKDKLGLDNLHIGLLQIVLLLLLRFCLDLFPSRTSKVPAEPPAAPAAPAPVAHVRIARRKRPHGHGHKKAATAGATPAAPSLYTPEILDAPVRRFLAVTEPDYLSLLPPIPSIPPATAALKTWKQLYAAPSLSVLQHPSTKSLYAISASFPEVSVRQLFETLCDVESRREWDSMCAGAENIDVVHLGGRRGTVAWLGMKGMAVVKAKDMVLLSLVYRLPQFPDEPTRLRLFCATTSFAHPRFPPRREYSRMQLGVSGFLIEEDGPRGSKCVQITDLSGLGSWVPSAVITLVTQSLIPKSLVKLGKAAAARDLAARSNYPLEGDDWLPPVLGSADDTVRRNQKESNVRVRTEGVTADVDMSDLEDAGDSEDHDEEEDEYDDAIAPIPSRDLHTLVGQLRSLTTRLTALEARPTAAAPPAAAARSWYTLFAPGLSRNSGGASGEQDQMTLVAKVGLTGGAVAAATAVAVITFWGRRKR